MLAKITTILKRPSTYVLLVIGALLALAVPAVRNLLAPVAAKIPGAN